MVEASFSFEWGVGVLLRLYTPEDAEEWGSPIDPACETRLPISDELRAELARLGIWRDTALNWDYPPDPGPWRQDECDQFNHAARDALRRLRDELGPTWNIVRNFPDEREDPDLDRYQADPRAFQRHPTNPH